jgi:hypothetical protein
LKIDWALPPLPFIPHQIKDYGVGIPVELAKTEALEISSRWFEKSARIIVAIAAVNPLDHAAKKREP